MNETENRFLRSRTRLPDTDGIEVLAVQSRTSWIRHHAVPGPPSPPRARQVVRRHLANVSKNSRQGALRRRRCQWHGLRAVEDQGATLPPLRDAAQPIASQDRPGHAPSIRPQRQVGLPRPNTREAAELRRAVDAGDYERVPLLGGWAKGLAASALVGWVARPADGPHKGAVRWRQCQRHGLRHVEDDRADVPAL